MGKRLLAVLLVVIIGRCAAGQRVFEGAVGFGTDTPAGRGGKVIKVTNLQGSGPGSLREALESNGRRTIVFEVGGVIDLECKGLTIREGFVTVAGQTAPEPGITIIRGGIYIPAHDVLLQHIRVRPGDAGRAKRSGWEPDGIATGAAYNVVVDHCSITWAVDENLSASGPRYDGLEATSHDITFSNCIIAEGLDDSSHAKGKHSKGSLIHDNCTNIAVIGNLYAHNVQRNPYFKAYTTGVVVNNVIYDPGGNAVQVGWPESEWKSRNITPADPRIAVVGNAMFHGVDTRKGLALVASRGDVFMRDNVAKGRDGGDVKLKSGDIELLDEPPVWPKGLKALPAAEVVDYVVKHVGARPGLRDEIDKRIIREFQQRRGRIIDSQDDVGGYPEVEMTRRKLDVPSADVEQWLAEFAADVE